MWTLQSENALFKMSMPIIAKMINSIFPKVAIYCPMIFDSYPMDTHICYFTLGSFKYDASYLNFSLGGLNFDNDKQVSILDYTPQVKPLSEVQQKSFYNEHSHYWSRTGFDIILKRNFKKYFIDFYVPSGILVTISWVSKKWWILN